MSTIKIVFWHILVNVAAILRDILTFWDVENLRGDSITGRRRTLATFLTIAKQNHNSKIKVPTARVKITINTINMVGSFMQTWIIVFVLIYKFVLFVINPWNFICVNWVGRGEGIYRRSHAGNEWYYDCTDIINRRSLQLRSKVVSYDCHNVYRRSLQSRSTVVNYDCHKVYREWWSWKGG